MKFRKTFEISSTTKLNSRKIRKFFSLNREIEFCKFMRKKIIGLYFRSCNDGLTPLLAASYNNHDTCVKILLDHGAVWRTKGFVSKNISCY